MLMGWSHYYSENENRSKGRDNRNGEYTISKHTLLVASMVDPMVVMVD